MVWRRNEKGLRLFLRTNSGCDEAYQGIFSVMNYELPMKGIMSMHCSANVGPNGQTSLFFGLSGTGKTTLSADPKYNRCKSSCVVIVSH